MTTIAEQNYYKVLKNHLGISEELITERFKDIRFLMKTRHMSFDAAKRKCYDTIPGSIRKEAEKVEKEGKKVLNQDKISV